MRIPYKGSAKRNSRLLAFTFSLCIASSAALQAQSFTQPLFIPDTLSTADNDTIYLTVEETQRVFFPGATTEVVPGHGVFPGDSMPVMTLSYTNPTITNPGILGPTLIWWKGDSVTMSVENTLMDTTTTHWHGAHVAPYNDGGPHQMIPPSTTWQPSFVIRDDVSTMWYHPHLHMMTMMQVNMGMAGMIIVKDANDPYAQQLPHTYGVDDIPIILQDKYFGQDFANMMDTIDTKCSMGTTFLVNGVWKPVANVYAQPTRLRILNGSSERSYCVFLYDSTAMEYVPFDVICSDAGYLNAPYQMGTPPVIPGTMDSLLFMMSGERYEIVFDPTMLVGHELYLINKRDAFAGSTQALSFAGGPNLNDPGCYAQPCCGPGPLQGMVPNPGFDSLPIALMKIVVGPGNGNPGFVPSSFSPYAMPGAVDKLRIKTLYGYNNDTAAPPFSIDTINFNMSVINDTIYLNDVEQWNVYNVSGVAHPFHIHDIHFFITAINGLASNVPPYMRGPKDVAPITDDSQFKLVMQFTDFATPIDSSDCYMYHCHILAHEDGGMMHQFVVTYPNNVGVHEAVPDSVAAWSAYPNPSTGNIWIEKTNIASGTLRMYDLAGVLVKEWNVTENENVMVLDVTDLAQGVYVLQMETEGAVSTQKVSITR